MNGLFLQGGGAKGAFQAGVLCALNERGVRFNVLTGTSIGSINGYFVLKNSFDEMRNAWETKDITGGTIDVEAPIIESSGALEMLKGVKKRDDAPRIKHFFVNYVPVVERQLTHDWSDLCDLDESKRFEKIRHSSLLPKGKGVNPLDGNYNLTDASERFKIDLHTGIYDEYVLDGGLLNNTFLEPFAEVSVEKLFMIVFKTSFEIPDYIRNAYLQEQLILIASDIQYDKTDTMNFSHGFLHKNFSRGYEMGMSVDL